MRESFDGPVVLEVQDRVARVTIDRADHRNALSAQVLGGLLAAMRRAAEVDSCSVAILTGAGDRAFSAGGDLGGDGFAGGAAASHFARSQLGDLVLEMQQSRLATVARVNGVALGGGFGLMLACDVVIARSGAEVGMPEIDAGLWPFIISALVQRHVGPKVALELMLTGRRMTAEEARDHGFVNVVAPDAGLDAAVQNLADTIASKSPITLELGKRSFYTSQDMAMRDGMQYLAGMLSVCLQTEDAAEGISAFLQKRRPQWGGR